MIGFVGAFAVAGFIRGLIGAGSPQRCIIVPDYGTDAEGNKIPTTVDGYITVEENHHDEVVATDNPVEQGAVISDHAYAIPAQLHMRLGWSAAGSSDAVSLFGVTLPTLAGLFGLDSTDGAEFINSVYMQMLRVMASRELLTIYTGKRSYANMLLISVDEITNQETENSLILDLAFRQIIITQTYVVKIPTGMSSNKGNMTSPTTAQPTANQGTQSLQSGTHYNYASGP